MTARISTVETFITRADLVRFNVWFLATAPFTYKYMLCIALGVLSYLVYDRGMPDDVVVWMVMVTGSLLTGFVATLVYFLWCIATVLMVSKVSNGILGKHEYQCQQDGLFEKTIANETLHKWGALGHVRQVGSLLLLQVSGYQYHVFPRHSFENQAQMDAFRQQLLNQVNQAKQLA